MRSWGITLLIIRIGSFILPMLNIQFGMFGRCAPIAGGVAAVAGLARRAAASATGTPLAG